MTMTSQELPAAQLRSMRVQAGLWYAYDLGFTSLLIALGGDLFSQTSIRSPLWLMCYALLLLRIAVSWSAFYPALVRNRIFLIYPLVCGASTVWSLEPKVSLTSAIQLTVTVTFGIFIGWRYSMRQIIQIMFWVLLVGVVLSLVHWATHIFPWPVYSNVGGLLGIFSQKNMLGQRGLYCAVAAMTLILLPSTQVSGALKAAATIGIGLVFFAILLSKSMTSVLLVPMALGLLMLLCIHRIPPRTLLIGTTVVVLGVALGPLLMSLAGTDPVDLVLNATGKDATLTGRTLLWQIARGVIAEYPGLGVGFGAFWEAPRFASARVLVVDAGATANAFHSFIFEILVGTGLPGLLAHFTMTFVALRRLVWPYMNFRSETAACGIVLITLSVLMSAVGTGLYRQHELMLMTIVMFGVAAFEDYRRRD